MKFIISLLFLVAVCNAAPQQPQSQYNNYFTTTTPAPILHPPASIHYVNIGQELNGDYKFGYDTGKGPSGQSFREETRLPDGTVKGQYGYLDAANKMRIVKYTAGLNGFSIDSDTALNEQQIAASKPTAPSPQYNPQPERPQYSSYQPQPQPQASARQSFQGFNQAAQSLQPQYLPAPQAAAQQAPYSGPASLPQYSANSPYGSQQLTPQQLQANAVAAARARQAALARQQQQEEIIRRQQQAATEQILAQQRAALEQQAAESAAAKQNNYAANQNSYAQLAAQYAAAQPQYQQQAPQQPAPQQPQYQAPQQPQYQPAPQPAPTPAPPTYQSPQYQPANYQPQSRTTELKADVLSQFIQLPGTRLIQIDKPRPSRPAGLSSSLLSSSSNKKPEEEENYGPVVINAALLNYDIGSQKLPNQPASNNNKKA